MVAGAYCLMSPLYSSEISQKEIRGALGSFTQMMISFGILFTAIISKYMKIVDFTIVLAVIPIIFAVTFYFMPESPIYLLKHHREQEARRSLERLRGNKYDIDGEIQELKTLLSEKRGLTVAVLKESFSKTATKRACVIVFGLMVFRVLCLVDAITTYSAYIFKEAGVAIDAQSCTIILTSIQAAAGILQSSIVDRLGRKILLLVSSLLMALCLTLVGVSMYIKERNGDSSEIWNYVPLIALCVFVCGYSLGLAPIPWMICGEIFPQELKSLLSSTANFTSWLFTFGTVKVFLVMVIEIGQDITFLIFAGITVIGFIYIFVFVRETKGKTFTEIQEILGSPSKPKAQQTFKY